MNVTPPHSAETEELRSQLQLVALPAVMDGAPPEAAVPLMAAMRRAGALLDAHVSGGRRGGRRAGDRLGAGVRWGAAHVRRSGQMASTNAGRWGAGAA